jgi:Flp pilus assembly protein TadD
MLTQYIRLTVWPHALVLLYGPPVDLTLRGVLPQALAVAALLAATILAMVRRPPLGFLGAWFFVTLAPTSSLVPIATEVGAERRMYLPLIAPVVLAVVAISVLCRLVAPRMRPLVSSAAMLLVATPLGAATLARNREYRDPLAMAYGVVERWPTGYAHYMLGTELAAAGRHDDATREFVLAVDSFPRARYNLGSELLAKGEVENAVAQFEEFLRREPLLAEVIPARLKVGQARLTEHRWAEAAAQFQTVLAMTPSNVDAQVLLAEALAGQRQFDQAIPHYRAYLDVHPNDVGALTGLGIALSASETHDEEALATFRRAVAIAPADARVRVNLARQLLIRNEVSNARAEYEQALRLDPKAADANLDLKAILQP